MQLERTKQLLPRLSTAAAGPEGATVEASDKPQPIARTVIDTVERHVIRQLSDFTATFPQGTSRMRGLIDVMRVAVECRSPGEGISRVRSSPPSHHELLMHAQNFPLIAKWKRKLRMQGLIDAVESPEVTFRVARDVLMLPEVLSATS